MFRALARMLVVIVIVVAVAAFFVGYRWGGWHTQTNRIEPATRPATPVGTTGERADATRMATAGYYIEAAKKGLELADDFGQT